MTGLRQSAAALLLVVAAPAPVSAAPDFGRDVAPILEQACLSCHNGQETKGDLDLSTRAAAFAFKEGIVPGDPAASLILKVVSGPEPDMPKKADPLTVEQIAILREWIASDAAWPEDRKLAHNPKRDLDWWSLRPLPKLDAKRIPDRSNPVDAFVDAKLREKGLHPVPEADPATLIRRVTYDLTGLPPTPEEVETFLANPDWEATVDRLLASPAFGEKFGQHWLDLARYAETHGYDKDKPRNNAWPYRDYVIRSFNEDKPYGRFVCEQVAGDVLFPGESDGVAALGFLAAGPWDFIGHWEVGEAKIDGRIAKHLDRDEMVTAVFNVFQSTTVQCAQCHHHKFDPVRMEDYYRLHAVFAAVDRADRVYAGLPPEQERRKNEVTARINALKQEQEKLTTQIQRLVAAKASGLDRRIAELKEKYGTGSELRPQYGYHSAITNNPDEEKWVQVDLGEPRDAVEVRIMPAFDRYNDIGAGFGFPPRYRVEVANDAGFKKEVRTLLDATAKDQPNPKNRTLRVNGDGEPFRFLRFTATRLATRKNDYILAVGEIEVLDEEGAKNFARGAAVTAKDSIESGVRWGRANLVDGIYFREVENPEAAEELAALAEQRAAIERSLRPPETDARLAKLADELGRLETERKAFPEGRLVYAAATHFPRGGRFTATEGKPRPIHLLNRGDIRSPGDAMVPGVPPLWSGVQDAFFSGESWAEDRARAELARYLSRQDNPLVWRSIANRLWQWTFGAPLVGTPNDFGRGGMQPTHPALLDFLAATLRDDPSQSLKSILRLLMTSRAYRRSSAHDPENAAIDADNAYLWRAGRRRLTAEEFRDSLLLISGALDRTMGGPSFQDFVIEKPQHSPHYEYDLHDPKDPKSHRRSVYRFIVRSQPQPMLTTLDCADPSMSVPERDESTTALQALTQWNHRFVEAMSERLAARIENEAPASVAERVTFACRLVLGRDPLPEELAILTGQLKTYGAAHFARVLFNLNAFVYVD
ncbi:MAG: DUF1549 domain-containing protein [Prosthecobacter sp.]